MRPVFRFAFLAAIAMMGGCGPSIAQRAFQLHPDSLAHRGMQSRRYDSNDEKKIMSACAGVLQDLGYTIDEGESDLGLLVASKTRSAVRAGEVALAFLAALGGTATPIDKEQTVKVAIVTRPFGKEGKNIEVRVTIQRVVINTQGQVTKAESVIDEKLYSEFFSNLSKAIFLEAQKI